jgi:hypothetical protein
MKMSLLVVSVIGIGFFGLSTASPAAPLGGGIHIRSGQRGSMYGSVGPHRVSAFRRNDRRFFRSQSRCFFPNFNVVSFGFPAWYPNYYYLSPDDNLENDNDSNGPGYDYQYQYWRDLAVRQQAELAVRQQAELAARQQAELAPYPKYNGPIAPVTRFVRPEQMESNYDNSPSVSDAAGEPDKSVTPIPNQPRETRADSLTFDPSPDPATKGGVFDKLVLVSWLNDAGKDVIFVKNTETDDVQRITSEPNIDQFRIIAIHPNADPRSFEAVISNGKEEGAVRFRLATRIVARP